MQSFYIHFTTSVPHFQQVTEGILGRHHIWTINLNSIDTSFYRNHECQFLIASEAYQVGTHDDHVNLVCRVGCPRTLTGWTQEFGRAGRSGGDAKGNTNLIAFSQIISLLICVDEN